jgi:hypothetical protein
MEPVALPRSLAAQVVEPSPRDHVPHRQCREEVQVEAQHHEIERAVDDAVRCAKRNEGPGGPYVCCVDLPGDEEIESDRIEENRKRSMNCMFRAPA